jgi:hypothetical protein
MPGDVGAHSTPTMHVALGPTEPSHVLLDTMNGGLVEILSMLIATFLEEFVADTVCSGLVVPSVTVPKLRLPGLTFRCAFPFPESAKTDAGAAKPASNRRENVSV